MKNIWLLALAFCILPFSSGIAQGGQVPPPPVGPTTQITFDQDVFEFGEILPGDQVQHLFRFTNTGKRPLVISNATGSCGCTVPSWPKYPIGPGESGAIVAVFDSKGKMGEQNKTITLTANTSPPQTTIALKGSIVEKRSKQVTANSADLSISPNPVKDKLLLKIENAKSLAADVEIFDNSGELVKQLQFETGSYPIQIETSDLVSGQYFLSVKSGDRKRMSLPFVVAK